MRIDSPPYWYWPFDRWNLLGALLLLFAFVVAGMRGCGAPAPASVMPTITQPAPGTALDYAEPGAVVGRAAPGALVRVYDGDVLLGETTADQAGYYRFSLPMLAPGPHSFVTRVYDASGKLIASSAPVAVTIRGGPVAQVSPTAAAAAATPTVQGESAAVQVTVVAGTPAVQPTAGAAVTATVTAVTTTLPAPAFTGLQDGAQLPADKPGQLTGIAAPGTKIQIYDGDQKIGETTAGADGKWSLVLPLLKVGPHSLTARAVGPDGAIQAVSEPVKVVVVPSLAIAAPAFTGLRDGAQLLAGVPGQLAGIAAPGTKIQIYDGDQKIGETTAGADGKWSLVLPLLKAGPHSLTARAVGPDGAVQAVSEPVKIVVGPALEATRPSGTAAATLAPAAATAAAGTVAPAATVAAPAAARTPPAGPAAAVEQGVTVAAGMPLHLTGTAAAGNVLRIYDGEKLLGEAVADATGQWNLIIPPLAAGTHSLTARVYDATGKLVSSSAPLKVTVLPEVSAGAASPTPGGEAPSAAATPAAGAAAITPGAPGATQPAPAAAVFTPQISSPQPGAELTTTSPGVLEGTGEPGATVRIYDGDKLVAELRVGADGKWRVALPNLGEGAHELTARIIAPDGSEATSEALTVTVKPPPSATSGPAAAPAKPSVSKPSVSSPKTGATVMSAQPLLWGRATPGVTVRIYDGNTLLGETTADARGNWYFIPPYPLGVGKHFLRVTTLLSDGTELSGDVIQVVVTEDATGFSAITFVRAYGKAPSQVGILQGTAPPGTIVRVYDGGTLLGRVQVDANGNWQFALSLRTKAGPHEFSIAAVTANGVVVYRSAPIEVIIK